VPPTVEHHALEDVSKGDDCPECETGKLYKYDPASFVRIESQPPFNAVQHVADRLRCNACGVFITATLPDSVLQDGGRGQKYGYGARALMAMNKYFAGHPFYRQGTLNRLLGVPMTASTIFDQCEHLANDLKPVHDTLLKLAADAWLYHIDDTGNRILDQKPVMKRSRHDGRERLRSGIHTSGMIAEQGDGPPLVLYQTSLSHAGELLDDVLRLRSDGSPPPLVMSDALSSNPVSRTPLRIALCNAHGRRNFADLVVHFPEEAEAVLTRYQLIWQHNTEATEQQMTAAQRLAHHRKHSLPVWKTPAAMAQTGWLRTRPKPTAALARRSTTSTNTSTDSAHSAAMRGHRSTTIAWSAVSSCRSVIARTPCSSRAPPVRPSTM